MQWVKVGYNIYSNGGICPLSWGTMETIARAYLKQKYGLLTHKRKSYGVMVLRIHIIRDGILGALSDAQAQFRHNLFKGVAV